MNNLAKMLVIVYTSTATKEAGETNMASGKLLRQP